MSTDALIISQYWPDPQGGGCLCVRSSMQIYQRVFSRIHFICVSDHPFLSAEEYDLPDIEMIAVPSRDEPKYLRFFKSLFSSFPAVTIKYMAVIEQVMQHVDQYLEKRKSEDPLVLILTDVAAAWYLRIIKDRYPWLPVVLQSQNVLVNSFDRFQHEGNIFERFAWQWEIRKIARFELESAALADRLWPLTQKEADEYQNWLGIQPDGVLGVALDTSRYDDSCVGDPHTVLFLGNVDLRKGVGLRRFVYQAWPNIRNAVPGARLLLGGRNTEHYSDRDLGIESVGFVSYDVGFLKRGMLFINPQQHGAGLQIKSIVAMLAGKALISTPTGIEGVEGVEGEHFLIVQEPKNMVETVIDLMRNPKRAHSIGQKARELAVVVYSTKRFVEESRPMLDAFVSKLSKDDT